MDKQEKLFKDDDFYPLSYRMRPQNFDEFVGGEEIIGEDSFLRKAIQKGYLPSLIIYGPPGSGKTTLSILLAKAINADFIELNAAIVGTSELKEALQRAQRNIELYKKRTVLFLDEIHHFNKLQQDVLLPFVEKAIVILIGATTENPLFTINTTLLSRCRIVELKPLSSDDIRKLIKKALIDKERGFGKLYIDITQEAEDEIVRFANGDARIALNTLELASFVATPDNKGKITIDLSTVKEVVGKRIFRYDQKGDEHYHTISAFIKSIRGSDPDAALYYLAKMILAGEDPRFIARRLMIHAAEDIGMADPFALIIAQAAYYAVEVVGMPEARIPLAEATIYLATAPKSNSVVLSIEKVMKYIQDYGVSPIPEYLRGDSPNYRYPHNFPEHFISQKYLPEGIMEIFYNPTEQGREKIIKERLEKLWGERYKK
ncbi:MAG TPA: replication-associated recombination protein A [Dictyoglomaceae bacterium]|nr:replication-associated recombination protein A [Dictyoglomaceae bacterium]HOL39717.1 replication-associated recombination protein A [Dictyoglomaceae bacterium]HOP95469.1 replication-associated recombination protein A [Dictyoglomaceae bacterium]HPP16150.1 replication-associated recombination protein A [Dictyoglomaceae bacterium]HPU43758.1 replication-associated recombination protein A [Dictyoglomaceae bacterium]